MISLPEEVVVDVEYKNVRDSAATTSTRPPLGQLLLATGACDRDALIQAWEQKVIFGDRLGTNLLALNLIDEKTLALTLGQQHHVHAAHGELIRIETGAVTQLSRVIALRHNVVPHHIEGQDLYLLMTDPQNDGAIAEVARATRKNVTPVVVCEARMWSIMTEHYGVPSGFRPIDLDDPVAHAKRRLAAQEMNDITEPHEGWELTSEADFYALYMRDPTSEAPAEQGPPEQDAPPVVTGVLEAKETEILDLTTPATGEQWAVDGKPPSDATAGDETRSDEAPRVFFAPAEADTSVEDTVDPLPGVIVPPASSPFTIPDTTSVDESPLSFDEATAALGHVSGRREIARIVLRYALTRFTRAALFTVHAGTIVGWKGMGEDFTQELLRTFRLPRNERSVFSMVAQSRAHYIGPLQPWVGNGQWVKHAGRRLPQSVAVFPVLVRGAIVNLLYGDNGHGAHVESDVGELLILAQRISASYENLLTTKTGPAPADPR